MARIQRFQIPLPALPETADFTIQIPGFCEVLDAGPGNPGEELTNYYLWALTVPGRPVESWRFRCSVTGEDVDVSSWQYIRSFTSVTGTKWHLFRDLNQVESNPVISGGSMEDDKPLVPARYVSRQTIAKLLSNLYGSLRLVDALEPVIGTDSAECIANGLSGVRDYLKARMSDLGILEEYLPITTDDDD